ncbi:hydantoinase B/oxoprolinase family protein [Aquibacillus sp. 3ASR75-11]|uniref:Hydantoinase B/oxoprolinase family protein n=1 Tax=Terrihalobacillus insolitus TaxID=2950438 RepID=A0A9X4APE4_9BACI|nr:hydantoinase B/oxoprolinase family protein [Terrihalobacillus insolitus]MDC3425455.1 hydantoinase B/oxoprolinase family protein [Terrihalobacillus insolitus]
MREENQFDFLENPVTTEIIRNALSSAAEEMNESLARSSYSPIIYEMKDCSVGIFNKDAELLGQSSGLPMFLGNLDECIKLTTEYIGGNNKYQPGDIFIMNDSYMAGTHLNDITVISPIFYKNDIVGFSATRAHWLDLGAKDPGYPMDATEIYQEGVRIPPTKIYDAGQPRKDIIDLITMNSRLRKSALGDLNAQIAACRTGENRMLDIIKRHGLDTIQRSIVDIFKQSEIMDKEHISRIPDGVYEEEGTLDNDGVTDEPVLVKVKVTVEGENLKIDLTGSSKQRKGMTNCGLAQTISACRVAFKHLISPDSQVTGGNFKTMEIVVPKKTIFSAEEPVACGWYFSALGLLIDLVIKALSPVLKEESAAAHYGDSMVVTFAGYDDKNDSSFLYVEPTAGGWGAFAADDGQSGLINNVNGDFKNLPVEVLEDKYPLKINSYGLRANSGGPGRNRGGLGIKREYELLSKDANLYLWFERSKTPAWGLFNGESGQKPRVTVKRSIEEETMLKVNARPITQGDLVVVETGGGGGFGHPFDRTPVLVLEDLLDGYIDKDEAQNKYGVVVEMKLDSYEIDYSKTEKYRRINR